MTDQERKRIVLEHKTRTIKGKFIDFVAYSSEHTEKLVAIRNQDKARFFFRQSEPLTVATQDKWYENYKLKDNDIYWCILDKSGSFIGAIRLYDIDPDGDICEQGSFLIDEAYAMGGPFALEAELISLNFAFDVLKVHRVLNNTRTDNKNMNSISRRLGFKFIENIERRGAIYRRQELTKEQFRFELLEAALSHWENR